MKSTGERMMPLKFDRCYLEHIHRYSFAKELVKDKVIVDIASGEGYGTYLLSSIAKKTIGIDISQEAVKHASKKYINENLKYINGSAFNIPIDTNTIDIVISFETIEHHDKHQEMISEIKRILKPDGQLIISTPDKLYYSDLPKINNEYHVKELYYSEFENLIQSNFAHSIFFQQKVTYSSLIINSKFDGICEYSGHFNEIDKTSGLKNPIYNIAIASAKPINNLFNSIFNGDSIFEQNELTIQQVLNSKRYKLGDILLKPLILIRNMFYKK